jgi:hypothetical protein
MSSIEQIIKDLETFDAIRDGWPKLGSLVHDLKASPAPLVDALLGVFERHPGTSSTNGVLMSVLHTLEAVPNYETHIVESLRRKPSVLTVLMVNRMLNSNITKIGPHSLMQLLEEAKAHPRCQRAVKAEIESILNGCSS